MSDIPIEFLIEKMGIRIQIAKTNFTYDIMIRTNKRRLQQNIDIRHFETLELSNLNEKISMMEFFVARLLQQGIPEFNKLDIDYTNLKKYIFNTTNLKNEHIPE